MNMSIVQILTMRFFKVILFYPPTFHQAEHYSKNKINSNINLVSDSVINEDSKAITFNYHNQYSDNRLYGIDLEDNSSRIVYGLENKIKFYEKTLQISFNQSYDTNENNNYIKKLIKHKFFDIALEAKTNFDNIFLK